ncbi:hypothetical protein [Zooshikella ganghwensis]|uniref:Uncharacterized protein n=1 Tax=Zooshikella ganghwensis TaxID=202772 RepID=A0A4P9VIM6_9GAMM|nr:hypothetical protein [Zooshikella ganghwensis]RDH42386.1 hypothetical protein B9G39_02420 [Zooshikella ganghwensis]
MSIYRSNPITLNNPEVSIAKGRGKVKLLKRLVLLFLIVILVLPYLLYWYGMSVWQSRPMPAHAILTQVEAENVWSAVGGVGAPNLKAVGPWQFVLYFGCSIAQLEGTNRKCEQKYAGFLPVILIIEHYQQQELIKLPAWQKAIVSSALVIWVTNNWTIDQVLASLVEVKPEYLPK